MGLSLGLTLTGTFLSHKFSTNREPRYKPKPVKNQPVPVAPLAPLRFSHVLVPGGKEAEDHHTNPREGSKVNTTSLEPAKTHFEDMEKTPISSWSVGKWGARRDLKPLSGPPDQLELRVDAFSFSCQECRRTIVLPWEKVKTSITDNQLQIDCPHCRAHYPFEYDRAQRKLLAITFHGVLGKEDRREVKPTKPSIPEPESKIEKPRTTEPQSLPTPAERDFERPTGIPTKPVAIVRSNNPLVEIPPEEFFGNRLGEAAKSIKNTSRVLVGSLANSRLLQTVVSRLQPANTGIPAETITHGQFSHVLVAGGKEGESLSQVIPSVPNKWAPITNDKPDPHHASFEDMPNGNKQSGLVVQTASTQTPVTLTGPPNMLGVHIEGFLFNCQDCDQPIELPWTRVEAGPGTPPFTVDCNNCHHQFPFNFDQAKPKTFLLRFKASLDENLPESPGLIQELKPATVDTPVDTNPVRQTSAIVAQPKYAIMALPKNAIVALRKYAILALRESESHSKTTDQTMRKDTRYSPGLEYDKAILERG